MSLNYIENNHRRPHFFNLNSFLESIQFILCCVPYTLYVTERSGFRVARSGACWSAAANSSALTSQPRPAMTSSSWRRARWRPIGHREPSRRRRRRHSSYPCPWCCGCAGHNDDNRTPRWSPATRALVAAVQGQFFACISLFFKSCFSGVSCMHLLYFLMGGTEATDSRFFPCAACVRLAVD